jgi:flagellar hook-length control protein FliK
MTTEDFINHRQNLGDHFEKIKAETSVSPQGAFVLPTATMAVSESLSLSQPQNTNIVQNHTVSLSESLSLVPPILTLANQGGGSIKLKVNPKELGEVTVTVAHEKGKLNVKLETQTHEARELIVNSMSELKNALAQARYEVADLQVVAKAEQKVSAPLTSHAFDNQGFWSEQNSDQRQQSQTWDRWSDARDFYENTKRQNQYKKQYELAMRA